MTTDDAVLEELHATISLTIDKADMELVETYEKGVTPVSQAYENGLIVGSTLAKINILRSIEEKLNA